MEIKDSRDKLDLLLNAISPYDDHCEGYGNSGSSGNSYILGFVLAVGKAKKALYNEGSTLLDEINAFDRAEVEGPYIGQINMSIVSSFCGPQGLIWGYDIAKVPNIESDKNQLFTVDSNHGEIPVYSLKPLIEATQDLLGTVDSKNFNLMPGAHVPCAGKNIKISGKGCVYSAIAIGIPEDRSKYACLLMEDVGLLKSNSLSEILKKRKIILEKIAQSVVEVGKNQKIKYKKILADVKFSISKEDEVACALVAAPYMTLAKKAVFNENMTPNDLLNKNLKYWIKNTTK